MSDFLHSMAEASRRRVEAARARRSEAELREAALAAAPPSALVCSSQGFDLIAEVKRRSPAEGPLEERGAQLVERVLAYAQAGAAAVSVLTEPSRFDGALEDLSAAASALAPLRLSAAGRGSQPGGRQALPALRKDFLTDPYQLYEARLAGAGGALLILRMLDRAALEALLEVAAQLRLFVLLEAFDEQDIALAHELVQSHARRLQLLIGLNCRDLSSLAVVAGRLEALAGSLPAAVPRVAESGVRSPADAARLARAGYDLALVGSELMRARDPGALVREMLREGRAAAASRR